MSIFRFLYTNLVLSIFVIFKNFGRFFITICRFQVYVDDYTKLLCADDARMLVDLLKLAVTGRCSDRSRESLSTVLSALGATNALVGDMLLELCVTELEDVATDTERLKSVPHPVTQESSHPYTDDAILTGHVRIPGAESLRVEFDRQCSTERRHDPLTIMDGTGMIKFHAKLRKQIHSPN